MAAGVVPARPAPNHVACRSRIWSPQPRRGDRENGDHTWVAAGLSNDSKNWTGSDIRKWSCAVGPAAAGGPQVPPFVSARRDCGLAPGAVPSHDYLDEASSGRLPLYWPSVSALMRPERASSAGAGGGWLAPDGDNVAVVGAAGRDGDGDGRRRRRRCPIRPAVPSCPLLRRSSKPCVRVIQLQARVVSACRGQLVGLALHRRSSTCLLVLGQSSQQSASARAGTPRCRDRVSSALPATTPARRHGRRAACAGRDALHVGRLSGTVCRIRNLRSASILAVTELPNQAPGTLQRLVSRSMQPSPWTCLHHLAELYGRAAERVAATFACSHHGGTLDRRLADRAVDARARRPLASSWMDALPTRPRTPVAPASASAFT